MSGSSPEVARDESIAWVGRYGHPDWVTDADPYPLIRVEFDVQKERQDLRALMHRYRNRPMSLADGCLVRMAELHPDGFVFTLDSDFLIYRRHGNKVIPVLMPDAGLARQ